MWGLVSILHLRVGHQALRSQKSSESGARKKLGEESPRLSIGLSSTTVTSWIRQVFPGAVVTKHEGVHGNLFLQLRSPALPSTRQSAPSEPTEAAIDWPPGFDITARRCQGWTRRVYCLRAVGGGSARPSSLTVLSLPSAPHPLTGEWARWLLAGKTLPRPFPIKAPTSDLRIRGRSWKPWNSYPHLHFSIPTPHPK